MKDEQKRKRETKEINGVQHYRYEGDTIWVEVGDE